MLGIEQKDKHTHMAQIRWPKAMKIVLGPENLLPFDIQTTQPWTLLLPIYK